MFLVYIKSTQDMIKTKAFLNKCFPPFCNSKFYTENNWQCIFNATLCYCQCPCPWNIFGPSRGPKPGTRYHMVLFLVPVLVQEQSWSPSLVLVLITLYGWSIPWSLSWSKLNVLVQLQSDSSPPPQATCWWKQVMHEAKMLQ